MLDIAVAYNRYRFLGNEFLTWLWFAIENDMATIRQCDPELVSLDVGNRMVLENRLANGNETITIKGDAAGLEEGMLALNKGAWVTELHLLYKSGPTLWKFSIKGENLSFAGLKLPETESIQTSEDKEGVVLEKLYLYEKPFVFIEQLYRRFIKLRLCEKWEGQALPQLRKWLQNSKVLST